MLNRIIDTMGIFRLVLTTFALAKIAEPSTCAQLSNLSKNYCRVSYIASTRLKNRYGRLSNDSKLKTSLPNVLHLKTQNKAIKDTTIRHQHQGFRDSKNTYAPSNFILPIDLRQKQATPLSRPPQS